MPSSYRKKHPPSSPFEIHQSEGLILLRNRNYSKAVNSFTKALEIKPDSLNCLIQRSKCYLAQSLITESLSDVEQALKINPTSYKAIYQKAEVFYYETEFENALMFYHRGKSIRPQFTKFNLGIQKAEEAINNIIGDAENIRFTINDDCDLDNADSRTCALYSSLENLGLMQLYSNISKKTTKKELRQIMGEFYFDVEYMKKLLDSEKSRKMFLQWRSRWKNFELKAIPFLLMLKQSLAINTKKTEDIIALADKAVVYLQKRSHFWRQQMPMYLRMKPTVSYNTAKVLRDAERQGIIIAKQIIQTLEEVSQMQMNGEYEKTERLCSKLIKSILTRKDLYIPETNEILVDLYAFKGISQFKLKKYKESSACFKKQIEVSVQGDLLSGIPSALENLGRAYAKLGEYQLALDVWTERLKHKTKGLAGAWLHHEIGRCYLEMNQVELAIEHGGFCRDFANKAHDINWDFKAHVLIAQSHYNAGNLEEARTYFELAEELAFTLNNYRAQDILNEQLIEVNNKIRLEEEAFAKENARMTTLNRSSRFRSFEPNFDVDETLTFDKSKPKSDKLEVKSGKTKDKSVNRKLKANSIANKCLPLSKDKGNETSVNILSVIRNQDSEATDNDFSVREELSLDQTNGTQQDIDKLTTEFTDDWDTIKENIVANKSDVVESPIDFENSDGVEVQIDLDKADVASKNIKIEQPDIVITKVNSDETLSIPFIINRKSTPSSSLLDEQKAE